MKDKRKIYWVSVLSILFIWLDVYPKGDNSFFIAVKEGAFHEAWDVRHSISNDLSISKDDIQIRKAYPYAQSGSFREDIYKIRLNNKEARFTNIDKELKKRAYITSVYQDEIIYVDECTELNPLPNDYFVSQNLISFINGECAWNIVDGGSREIKLAIIDEIPANYEHYDLEEKVDKYTDMTGFGVGYHGIPVSGDAAAHTDNDTGISSIGYNTGLFLYNVATSVSGGLSLNAIINAIDKAVLDGAHIINCSFSTGSYYVSLNDAIQNAIDSNIVVLAAAGAIRNDSLIPSVRYPCGIDGVICVTDVDLNNNHSHNQNYHERVDICAPSKGFIALRNPNELYTAPGGSSHSTPIVAGIVALMKTYDLSLSPSTIRSIVKQTGRPVNNEYLYPNGLGGGTVDAYRAVRRAASVHLQKQELEGISYFYSEYDFYAGNAVLEFNPHGDVIIKANSNVEIEAQNVYLEPGFEVELGAVLTIY